MNVPLHIKNFNERVRVMNQSQSKNITLTAQEARSLQADILDVLNHCVAISMEMERMANQGPVSVGMDGGGFS